MGTHNFHKHNGSNYEDGKVHQGAFSHVRENNREDQNILLEEDLCQDAKRAVVRGILEEAMDEMKEKSLDKVLREKEAPLNKVEEEIQQLKKQLCDI
ncbi:hypothetical protein FNV43_RR21866 [Rhamnella rubrinervis]|uniref:Uncharacterized protein n=1 Tax=Rhamnella rubrinervis TaxID=2594499 RepID=A0A8K0DPD2_9ROSA|nr:hypothetical protein FNV43_RR21866 [Rhamnella rubrinervis]